MERLKIVLAVAALLATAHTSPGQQVPVAASGHLSGRSAQPSYVVIGDVQNFNYFSLSAKTTVRQAVLEAGLLSDSVNVSIVRASQDRALWTQVISTASADSGELVQNGDLLVVQSLAPVTVPMQKNAALRTDAGVIVVALADEPIAAGDVLLQTNNRPAPEQRLSISCRFRGRTAVARATLTDEVAHGDVLTLSRANPAGLKGFGSLVPVVTEWQGSVSPAPLTPAIPVSEQVQFSGQGVDPEMQSPGFLMRMPVTSAESEDDSFGAEISPSDPFADTRSTRTAVADVDAPSGLRLVSQVLPNSDSDDPIVAPHPPMEYPELADSVDMATASAQMSPWNLLFIGGLLVAGTLIFAASLRADEEPGSDRISTQVRSEQTIAPVAANKANTVPQIEIAVETAPPIVQTPEPTPIAPTDVNFAGIVSLTSEASSHEASSQETVRTNVTASSLVSMNEWYGKDWLSTEPKRVTGDDINNRPTKELVSPVSSVEEVRAEQGGATMVSEPSKEVTPATEPLAVEQATDIPEVTLDNPVNGFADLEDLLLNRLPIDLCTTRLPLQIALYGRPAGPRRLRIDAAHDNLAAPHMIRSNERIREKAGVASDSPSNAKDTGSEVTGSLNRALHQLHERTDHDLCD